MEELRIKKSERLTTLHPSAFLLLPSKKRRVPPGERDFASSDGNPGTNGATG
jgi:hypothetical protein